MAVLASIGTAGEPGVGLVMLTMVLTQVGLPIKGIAIILGVDRLMDMIRTAVNITADAIVTTIVAKGEGKVDMDIFNNLHVHHRRGRGAFAGSRHCLNGLTCRNGAAGFCGPFHFSNPLLN
jgi:Na+/H+-dicarboxylate symporter